MAKPSLPGRKLTEQEKQAAKPWLPPPYELADAYALQALQRGDATPEQQSRALNWIIYTAAGTYDLSWRPEEFGGARATDFAEGRRFVGTEIVKLLKLNTSSLRKDQA